MNQKKIITLLQNQKLDGWKVVFTENERCSLFYTKNGLLETSLDSKRTEATITIYKQYNKQMGDSSFTIHSDDETIIKQHVKDALVLCSTAKNPSYPLSTPKSSKVSLADEKIIDSFAQGSQEKTLLLLWKQLSLATPKNVRIAACELSLGISKTTIVNSSRKSVTSLRTRFFIECPLTAYSKDNELEYLASTSVLRLSDFDPKKFIMTNSKLALDVLSAKNVTGVYSDLILSGDALRDFWSPDISTNPLIFHASARAKYMELSNFSPKNPLGGSFTLYSNPLIDYNPHSSNFDLDGTASLRVKLVASGRWNKMIASARYAHYLGVPITGALGSIELDCPTHFSSSDGCVEIVSFSSFVPNGPSGDFSAEIRLGYLHKNGKRTPLRAGMFSGNLFSMLGSMQASKQNVVMDGYKGPLMLRFSCGAALNGI